MRVITIGRSAGNNDIVVNDVNVSRNHLQIIQDDNGNYSVVDMGSTNGTYVNGKRISGEVRLQPGDQVLIGSTMLPWESYFAGAPAPQPEMAAQAASRDDAPKRNLTWLYFVIGGVLLMIVAGVVIWLVFGKPKSPEVLPLPADTTLMRMQEDVRKAQEEADASLKAYEVALREYERAKAEAAKDKKDKTKAKQVAEAEKKLEKATENKEKSDKKVEDAQTKVDEKIKQDADVNGESKDSKDSKDTQEGNEVNGSDDDSKVAVTGESQNTNNSQEGDKVNNGASKITVNKGTKESQENKEGNKIDSKTEGQNVKVEGKTKDDSKTGKDKTEKPLSLDEQFYKLFNSNRMKVDLLKPQENESFYKSIYKELGWNYGFADVSAARNYLQNEFKRSSDAEKQQIVDAMNKVLFPQKK